MVTGYGLNMPVIWLIAMVVFLAVEAIVPGLVSLWFAFGALAAVLASLAGAPFWLQVLWFLLVSVASLALTRPLAKKYVNGRVMPTNADRVLGKECVVREAIDNLHGTGAVAVDGKVWTARTADDSVVVPAGETVTAVRIEGVKLIVEKK